MPASQLRFLLCFLLPGFVISFAQRLVLVFQELGRSQVALTEAVLSVINGVFSDVVALSYSIPLAVLLMLCFSFGHMRGKKWVRITVSIIFVLNTAFWAWSALSEWYFWQDFSGRFNFIAVDYLIYTKEIAGNIAQSFSMPWVFTMMVLITTAVSWPTLRLLRRVLGQARDFVPRLSPLAYLVIPALMYPISSLPMIEMSSNIGTELARNGTYEFFSAFHNNELDFKTLYANIELPEAIKLVGESLASPEVAVTKGPHGQWIQSPKGEASKTKYNLIVVAVESLGARFIGSLGNQAKITPRLDELSEQSLFFTNLYATGTRTVRGLEALTLSIPPTPGASIVRRKKNQDLMSIGGVLKQAGYATKFIYGGHGIFDNMNSFFRKNGYRIVDRTDLADDEITFTNAWGVADEDLFRRVVREADATHAQKKPFFSMVLTTSNHRPFTYPHGKIDIPSHTGRDGAVKYTDYALGKFLDEARTKPWFKDTIIVIVADHSADGRGVIDVPIETYHIPMWIYAPGLLKPRRVDTVASQIDMIPTVLNLMGVRSPYMFMGRDILGMKKEDERFFAGTYQKVGMYKRGVFSSLGPKGVVESHSFDPANRRMQRSLISDPEQEKLTIAHYQYASWIYKEGYYKIEEVKKAP